MRHAPAGTCPIPIPQKQCGRPILDYHQWGLGQIYYFRVNIPQNLIRRHELKFHYFLILITNSNISIPAKINSGKGAGLRNRPGSAKLQLERELITQNQLQHRKFR